MSRGLLPDGSGSSGGGNCSRNSRWRTCWARNAKASTPCSGLLSEARPACWNTSRPFAASSPPSHASTTGLRVPAIGPSNARAASSDPARAVGQNSSSTPSFSGSAATISNARASRCGSASPITSIGSPCDQDGGSTASSAARAESDTRASTTPSSATASAASTPGLPPLVRIARRDPIGMRLRASVSAATNSWSYSRIRIAPLRRKALSHTRSLPANAPVWLSAALEPTVWRPAFNTITGLTLAAARTADRNRRGLCTPSTYSAMLRVSASIARKSSSSANSTSEPSPVVTTEEKPKPASHA